MATIAEGGLFPPILPTYQKSMLVTDLPIEEKGLPIYFNLSDFESPSQLKSVHISIYNQISNKSLLKVYYKTKDGVSHPRFTRGIVVLPFDATDNYDEETGMYKVVIPPIFRKKDTGVTNHICNFDFNELDYNTYYKIQMRMSKIDPPTAERASGEPDIWTDGDRPAVGRRLANHLTNESNLVNFSEWSAISLIRFVAPRVFQGQNPINSSTDISNLDRWRSIIDSLDENGQLISSALKMSGFWAPRRLTDEEIAYFKYRPDLFAEEGDSSTRLQAGDTRDGEYLNQYQVKIYDISDTTTEEKNNKEGGVLLFESPVINSFSLNEINYNLPYHFTNGEMIRIEFYGTTANIYETVEKFNFSVNYAVNNWSENIYVEEVDGLDSVIGKFFIGFEPKGDNTTIPANVMFSIRRADDTDNFGYWSLIYEKTLTKAEASVKFEDFTIESGTLYKYEIIISYKVNNEQKRFRMEVGPILSIFDNAFLTGEGTQLCVRFNPNVSSFKRNVSDSIVNTIGGQYPYITRNGHMNYRSFSLSGSIAYEMDLEHQFASRSSIYGDWIEIYGSYFVNHYYNQGNDKVTQRKFRELVMEFLYDDMPKLFRSTPEGNILIRITDVTLTPNQQLGRMIYDFSCTATEIGEANIDNYKLYKIQDFGDI